MAYEIQSTKGKGWIVVGLVFAILGVGSCMGGNADAGVSMVMLGAACYGIGKAIRWWVRPDR
jgi:hypothetical protein